MRAAIALTMLVSIVHVPAAAQSLRGTWKRMEVVQVGGRGPGRYNVEPGLMVFTPLHYSRVIVRAADAGTYELRDSVLTLTPVAAYVRAIPSGSPRTVVVRIRGDSLWWVTKAHPDVTFNEKWVRLETLDTR